MTPNQLINKRKQLGLSQRGLADLLPMYDETVSVKTIQAWEQGTNPIPRWLILALAAIEFNKPGSP